MMILFPVVFSVVLLIEFAEDFVCSRYVPRFALEVQTVFADYIGAEYLKRSLRVGFISAKLASAIS
jgi:hypothetical protein